MALNVPAAALSITLAVTLIRPAFAAPLAPNDPLFDANAALNATHSALTVPADQVEINTNGAVPTITSTFTLGESTIVRTHAEGIVFDQGPISQNGVDDWNRHIAVFVFPSDLILDPILTSINVIGDRPFALLARGNITLNQSISVNGTKGDDTTFDPGPTTPGTGRAGGGDGGAGNDSDETEIPPAMIELATGQGPGSLPPFFDSSMSNAFSTGAGFGGRGVGSSPSVHAPRYGDLLDHLQGGSGGSGSILDSLTAAAGGAGGGAVELGATGTITINENLTANGARGGNILPAGVGSYGGAGSGGGLLLHGTDVILNANIRANAGNQFEDFIGGAGGGRIAILETDLASYTLDAPLSTIGLENVQANASNPDESDARAGQITITPQKLFVPNNETAEFRNGAIFSTAPVTDLDEKIRIISDDIVVQNGGTADYDGKNALPDTTTIKVNTGAQLNTNAFNDTIDTLNLIGNATLQTGSTLSTNNLQGTGTATLETSSVLALGHDGGTTTFTGTVTGPGGITILGGTHTLNGTNNYTGPTQIAAGTLTLDDTLRTNGDDITIEAPATLQAAGVILRHLTGLGTLELIGPFVTGDLASTDGYDFPGTLNVGSNQLVLLDADRAQLGAQTNIDNGALIDAINGATLDPADTLTATGPASIDGAFTNNGTVNGPTTPGEFLVFEDDVNGTGNYTGNILFEKAFSPGASPGAVRIGGDLQLGASATLLLELGGDRGGDEYDQLHIAGTFYAGGTLRVELLGAYHPRVGDEFELLGFTGSGGAFSAINLPGLRGGLAFDTTGLLTTGRLAVVPEPGTLSGLGLLLGALHGRGGRRGLGRISARH